MQSNRIDVLVFADRFTKTGRILRTAGNIHNSSCGWTADVREGSGFQKVSPGDVLSAACSTFTP